jgi:hypothetical protein
MSNFERKDPFGTPLRSAVLHYFQWLTAVPPGSDKTDSNKGSKVLAAILEEFPELEKFAAPTLPVPELKVRFDSYPFHMSRLNFLENRVAFLEMVVQQGPPPGPRVYVPPPPQGTQPVAYRTRPPDSMPAPPPSIAATNKNVGPAVLRPPAASKQPPSAAASTQPASETTTASETTASETTPTNGKRKNPPDTTEISKGSQKKRKQRKKAPKTDQKNVVSWEERYEQLEHYQKGYGHCRVPERSVDVPGLGQWVKNQRRDYKGKKLTPEKIAKLEELKFQWVLQDKPHKTWEESYEQLEEFHRENGHTRVPRRTYKKNPSLGEWVHNQRFNYQKKVASLVETDRLKKLQEIGFEFTLYEERKSWDERFEQLVEFRRNHGHCNVPIPMEEKGNRKTIKQPNGETVALKREHDDEFTFANYVRNQKANYLKYKNGDHKALTQSRFKKLDDLGIGLESNQPSLAPKPPVEPGTNKVKWNTRLEQLRLYKERHGDCNVPHNWPENKKLAKWVKTQRENYRLRQDGNRVPIAPERIQALESLGFQWERGIRKGIEERASAGAASGQVENTTKT